MIDKKKFFPGKLLYVFSLSLLIVILLTTLITGCTKSDDSSEETSVIVVSHEIDDEMPTSVDHFHYSFLDSEKNILSGPIAYEKAESHSLSQVPLNASYLKIEYYDYPDASGSSQSKNELLGSSTIPVSPSPGKQESVQVSGNPTAEVSFAKSNGKWQIVINGNTSFIKGVGGDYGGSDPKEFTYSYINASFTQSGANTIRTYGSGDSSIQVRDVKAVLALAKKLSTDNNKVHVLVGFVFNGVADPVTTNKAAYDQIIADPNADHVLGWCLGNEIADSGNVNATINSQINQVAEHIQKTSKLPIMTAVPNPTAGALSVYSQSMPQLDCLAINSFYGKYNDDWKQDLFLSQVGSVMSANWDKPWFVSEYYSYDLPSAAFGSYNGMPNQTINNYQYFLELNSTANAKNYKNCWNNYILGNKDNNCVGGIALNWMPPHNSQVPGFWKDMFVYKGKWQIYVNWYDAYGVDRLECVDAVTTAYGGTPPSNGCPQIVTPSDGDLQGIDCDFKVTLTSAGKSVKPGDTLTASVTATDSDSLTFDWYLMGGELVTADGGGITDGVSINTFKPWGVATTNEPLITSSLIGNGTTVSTSNSHKNTITFTLDPSTVSGNNYQLRVIVRDGNGGAATAAIAFAVE